MTAFDVAIVGAGVHGASAALWLAERGARVVVLERHTPASGPTGQSSAVVRGYYVNETLARLTHESIELFHGFTDWTHGGQAGFVTTGALFLHPAEDATTVRDTARRLTGIGIRTEVLGPRELAHDFPVFTPEGIGLGAWEPGAGYADPAGTTVGMLERVRRLGARVRPDTEVTHVEPGPGAVRLRTARGERVTAGRVLLAAGPWTAGLLATFGVRLPLRAERHIVSAYGWGTADPVPYVWASMPDGIYAKPEGTAGFLVGTLREEPPADSGDFARDLTDGERIRLTEPAVRRAPHLADAVLASGYAGLYDVAPDWQPVIGLVEERVVVVAGTAGHGFKWAPALGRLVAGPLTGEPADPAMAEFRPGRFEAGELLAGGYGDAKILG